MGKFARRPSVPLVHRYRLRRTLIKASPDAGNGVASCVPHQVARIEACLSALVVCSASETGFGTYRCVTSLSVALLDEVVWYHGPPSS